MAGTFSFDIISDYDVAGVINAVDQTAREVSNRYDLKGTTASVAFRDAGKTGLTIVGDSHYMVEALIEIIRKKFGSRGVSQKVLDVSRPPVVSNLKTSQDVPFKKGLDQEKAKQVTAMIRARFPKVKAQIQGAEIRVVSPKKDELQAVMHMLEVHDFDFPLSFTNFR